MSSFLFFTVLLGIVAGALHIVAYAIYARRVTTGRIRPNSASWSIWAFGAVLESVSYIVATGDWVKNLLPAACALCAIALFFFCLTRGHFGRLTRLEWFWVILDFTAIFVWWQYQSAVYANLLLVFTAVVSFIPIIMHAHRDPKAEDAVPWYLWSITYAMLTVVVLVRWEKWEDLAYPVVFTFLHLIVAMVSTEKGTTLERELRE